jgi:hypothetical protein
MRIKNEYISNITMNIQYIKKVREKIMLRLELRNYKITY